MNKRIGRLLQRGPSAVLLLLAIAATLSFAQDMKPLSSILAKSISASGRKTVAVVDFTDLQGNVTELGRYLAEELSVDLVGDAKGFEVIERNQLKVILQEHRLSTTGLIDPQTARKLGQFAGVDALVTGTITAFGDTVRLSAKVLDTQTARMLGAATFEVPRTRAIEDLLQRGIAGTGPPKVASGGSSDLAPRSSAQFPSALKPTIVSGKAWDGQGHYYPVDLMFTPKTCTRQRQELTCLVQVINKGERGLEVDLIEQECSLLDDQGNQYKLDTVSIGQKRYEHLEPEVPINIVAVTDNVSIQVSSMSLLVHFRIQGMTSFKTAVRNIPIEKQ